MRPPWAPSCCCLLLGPWEGHTREAYLGRGRGEVTTSPCLWWVAPQPPAQDHHGGDSQVSMNGAGRPTGQKECRQLGEPSKDTQCPQLLPLWAKPSKPPSLASPRGRPHHHTRPRRPPGGDSRAGPRAAPDRTAKPSRFPDSAGHPAGWAPRPPRRRRPQGRPALPRSPAPGRPQRRPAGPSRRHTRCPSAHHATPPGGQRTRGARRPDAAGGPDLDMVGGSREEGDCSGQAGTAAARMGEWA